MFRRLFSLCICTGILAAGLTGAGLAAGCSSRALISDRAAASSQEALTEAAVPGSEQTAETTSKVTVAEDTNASAATEATIAATAAAVTAETTIDPEAHLIKIDLMSDCIGDNNILGDPGKEQILIYLPPAYHESDIEYPVVYYFHGFGEAPGRFLSGAVNLLDNYFESGADPFIMVEVAGTGFSSGSFYVNSPVNGNWEDYVVDEVIPYVDGSFRTIAKAASRGICGFSMGGFGAMNLALLHPDVFAAVYAMSPGMMTDDALAEAMETWTGDSTFLTAYARAFAPDVSDEDGRYGEIPTLDQSAADDIIAAKWYSGFGNWSQKIDAYLALGTPLKAIAVSYGNNDSYTWIPTGTADFAQKLRANGIDPVDFAFEGGHQMPVKAVTDHLGSFFTENLSWEE